MGEAITAEQVASLGTVLGVWAHPDDEVYLSGGLMAACARAGSRVVCVTATRGEAGSWDEERWPPETLGAVRQAELERCLEILGVREHHWLEYPDGGCDQVPPEQAVGKVAALFEEVAPDSVLTFGPEGMTDHADHKAVHRWTTEAFRRSARPGARLYYATTTPQWAERFVPTLQRFNVFGPGSPPITPREHLAIGLELPAQLMDLKLEAIEAHDSQIDGMRAAFGRDFMRESNTAEYFRLAEER